MKTIPLTQGKVALVDDADYDTVIAAGSWRAKKSRNTFYAAHGSQTLYMHQFIFALHGCEGEADHQNFNGLDNQFHNLRPATDSQNQQHRNK